MPWTGLTKTQNNHDNEHCLHHEGSTSHGVRRSCAVFIGLHAQAITRLRQTWKPEGPPVDADFPCTNHRVQERYIDVEDNDFMLTSASCKLSLMRVQWLG